MITNKGIIYFTDPRNFGTLKVINDTDELQNKLQCLGYDVLDDNEHSIKFNVENFNNIKSKKPSEYN